MSKLNPADNKIDADAFADYAATDEWHARVLKALETIAKK